MQEALLLRVNPGSEFGRGVEALLSASDGLTKQELDDAGGMARTSWGMRVARVWFDNLIVTVSDDLYAAQYINVVPDSNGRYLRVRENSDLGRALRALLAAGGPVDEDELAVAAGMQRVRWSIKLVDRWFDNISINAVKTAVDKWEFTARYMDVAPRSSAVTVVEKDGRQPVEPIEQVRWPEAPPVLEPFDFFRKPSFYDTMAMMVEAGRHISLEGPPGTGKDTAVMQLAAEQGKVLVTIGGDGGFRRRHLEGTQELQNGSSYFMAAEFATAAINGWWVLLTEVNAADADALMYLNKVLEVPHVVDVHGKTHPVHPDFRFFITYNAGLVGTKPLPPSFKDRFFPIKIGFFSEYQLKVRLMAHGLPDPDECEWADMIVKFGLAMWNAHENGQMRYQITVRRLIDAIALCQAGVEVREALKSAVIEAIDSPVEYKAAEQVLRNLRTW